MLRPSFHCVVLVTAVVPALLAPIASGQVFIDMPPPPAPKVAFDAELLPDAEVTVGEAIQPPTTAPSAVEYGEYEPSVGEVALSRYARNRTGTYDTYFSATPWNNRWNNSSWWWNGGGWGWGWGWGWPVCNVTCKPSHCGKPSGGKCGVKSS